MVAVPKAKILSKSCKYLRLFLRVGFDDKGSIARGLAVLLGLALDEPSHIRCVILGRVPGAVDLVGGTGKVVVRILQRNLIFIWASADINGLIPNSP